MRASGVVPNQDAKTSITDALNAVFGADKVKSDIGVDKNATPAPWLGAFRAVMDAIKGANVDAIFQGDKINVGGAAMTDSARDKVIAALKGVVGAGVTLARSRTRPPQPSPSPTTERRPSLRRFSPASASRTSCSRSMIPWSISLRIARTCRNPQRPS